MATAADAAPVEITDVKDAVTCNICLQLFTDPRCLRCSHTFCLHCLNGYQGTNTWKECPICREDSIPCKNDLDKLPVNKLAINLVSLVKTYEPAAEEPVATWEEPPTVNEPKKIVRPESPRISNSSSSSAASSPSGHLEQLMGRLAELQSLMEDRVGGGRDLHQRLLASALEDDSDIQRLLERHHLGEFEGEDDRTVLEGVEHVGIKCDICKRNLRGARYKCGICSDFDLCYKCAEKPRGLVHDAQHIFIKLKQPRTISEPSRQVLHEDSVAMGMSIDTNSERHVIQLSDGELNSKCSNCGTEPITGVRYKCGNCQSYDLCSACEQKSEELHDPKHIFLVLQNPTGLHTTKPQLAVNFYN